MAKCIKCGSEKHSGQSDCCDECQTSAANNNSTKPLDPAEMPEKPVSKNGKPGKNNSKSEVKSSNLNGSNDDLEYNQDELENARIESITEKPEDDQSFTIKEVNFDDSTDFGFAISDKPDDISPLTGNCNTDPENDNLDSDTLEIEKDLTLYRDDEMQITMEQTSDGPEIMFSNLSEQRNKIDQSEANSEHQILKNDMEKPSDIVSGIGDNEGSNITQKIIVNPQVEKQKQSTKPENHTRPVDALVEKSPEPVDEKYKETSLKEDSKSVKMPDIPELQDTTQSSKIAYVSGNRISFPGGFKPVPGEEITVGTETFNLKVKESKKWLPYIILAASILLVMVITSMIFNPGATGDGQIVGLLQNPNNGKPVTKATVTIKELGISTSTNYAGFFIFDMVPSGIYTVVVEDDGVGILSERMPVIDNRTSTLTFKLPADEISTPSSAGTDIIIQKNKELESTIQKVDYGFLKLKIQPSKNTKVYLDNKYIGKGSQTFKVSSGKHKVTVKKNGYRDYNYNVNIPFDQIKSYTFKLKKAPDQKKTGRKSDEQTAVELEEKGKFSDALSYYSKIYNQDESNIEALTGMARCYRARGDNEQALSSYLKAARLAKNQDNTPMHLEALSGVLDINPNYISARYNRGIIYLEQGENYRAAQDFSRVIEIDKRNLNAYYKLGKAYFKSKNYPAALNTYLQVKELNFADSRPYAYMSKIYLKTGDSKKMKKSYEKFEKNADMLTKNKFASDPDMQEIRRILGK